MHILRRFFQKLHAAPPAPPKPQSINSEILATIADDLRRAERFLNHVQKLPSNPNFCDVVCAVHSLRLARVTLEVLGKGQSK